MRSVEEDNGGYMPKLWAAEPRRGTFLYELWVSAPGAVCRIGCGSAFSITICDDFNGCRVDVALIANIP
jgi:hypothetical protein